MMQTNYILLGFKKVCVALAILFVTSSLVISTVSAQSVDTAEVATDDLASTSSSTATSTASSSALEIAERLEATLTQDKKDTTKPEQKEEKVEIIQLLESRQIEKPNLLNFLAYWVQEAVFLGIPANTIFLILLIPVFATLWAFVRVVLGLQTLELLVPIALAFALVSVGVTVGLVIFIAILLASYVSKMLLKRVSIMFFPKRALSMTLLAFFVFAALTVVAAFDIGTVQKLSIFPVLMITLLGDSVVTLQLYKRVAETISITVITIGLGLLGFVIATSATVFNTVILHPEIVLLTVPANIMIGRYFGLRLTEYFRFEQID